MGLMAGIVSVSQDRRKMPIRSAAGRRAPRKRGKRQQFGFAEADGESWGAGGLVWAYGPDGLQGVEFQVAFWRPFAPLFRRDLAGPPDIPTGHRAVQELEGNLSSGCRDYRRCSLTPRGDENRDCNSSNAAGPE
jgi:hypothetical protein